MRFIYVLLFFILVSFKAFSQSEVQIGTQIWMTKNLDVDRFRNGDKIPEAKTEKEWKSADANKKPAWCYYDNDPANGEKYGKLYNWYAVIDPRGLAPDGWHIPTTDEWESLITNLGGDPSGLSGNVMFKLLNKNGWNCDFCCNGTNESGFSALPSGYLDLNEGFSSIGNGSWWWNLSEDTSAYSAKSIYIFECNNPMFDPEYGKGGELLSVRCIKGNALINSLTFHQQELHSNQHPNITNYVLLETNYGSFTLGLYGNDAPKTVANFVGLINKNFYDGILFHRVVPNFVIQAGDPMTKEESKKDLWGRGGESIYGAHFADELDSNTNSYQTGYAKGVLAMANRGPNTNSSQFFICLEDLALPKNYTIFGKVTDGMDIIERIESVPLNGYFPRQPVIIESVRLLDSSIDHKSESSKPKKLRNDIERKNNKETNVLRTAEDVKKFMSNSKWRVVESHTGIDQLDQAMLSSLYEYKEEMFYHYSNGKFQSKSQYHISEINSSSNGSTTFKINTLLPIKDQKRTGRKYDVVLCRVVDINTLKICNFQGSSPCETYEFVKRTN